VTEAQKGGAGRHDCRPALFLHNAAFGREIISEDYILASPKNAFIKADNDFALSKQASDFKL